MPYRNFSPSKDTVNLISMIFSFSAMLLILTGYACSIFESIGDYAAMYGCHRTLQGKTHEQRNSSRGLFLRFVFSFGGLPVTSASQNAGIIASTGIASGIVTQTAAFIFSLRPISQVDYNFGCYPEIRNRWSLHHKRRLDIVVRHKYGNVRHQGQLWKYDRSWCDSWVSVMMPYYLNLERSAGRTLRPFTSFISPITSFGRYSWHSEQLAHQLCVL